MDYSFNGSMKEFIKGRIDAAMYSLEKKDPDYLGLLEKRSEIYDRIDRSEGAKPVPEQLSAMQKDFEEWFIPQAGNPAPKLPQFGAKPEGGMPKGEEGAVAAFTNAWGFKK